MPQFNEGNINSYLVPSGSLTGSLSNSGTLTGQIAIGSGGGTSDYNDLSNKPQINSVTLSGNKTTSDLNISYNDLDDKPTIPAAQVNSDWNAVSGVAEILNKPTLAAVATSGSYNDLIDKPAIPTSCSITKGSTMPSTFPVPNISRRGNTVIIRLGILLPAGSYTTSDVLWNYTPLMVDLPALTFPVYGSGEVNLIKILPDGTITINSNKTFNSDTWLIGEAVFLTDG